ncbi:Zinc finger protein 4 [Senna tora]|uniref:Zinc finger protein 4 n=1 Tax=Senna tora TaxID=362788 RepID=A0A834TNQ0_9FABA|nr:Zinc finger protein 4 [Senna tora]
MAAPNAWKTTTVHKELSAAISARESSLPHKPWEATKTHTNKSVHLQNDVKLVGIFKPEDQASKELVEDDDPSDLDLTLKL